ncbi:hypothetical protein EDD17DRAFT_312699 [Pisolithus thermaeus]|nr:hypothetical protein EDD17DRAFT_312699 [Pisolithus thermaeus]
MRSVSLLCRPFWSQTLVMYTDAAPFARSPHLRAPGPYKVFVWLPEGEDANEHLAIHVVGGKVLPLGPFLRRGVPGYCG